MKVSLLTLSLTVIATVMTNSALAQGSCTASFNCSTCNSGGFTIMCTYTSAANSICDGCTPGGCGSPPCNKCCRLITTIQNGDVVTQRMTKSYTFSPSRYLIQTPIEVAFLKDAKLSISDAEPQLDENGFKSLAFKLTNLEAKDLIALGVVVDLYWDSRKEPVRIVYSNDGWFLRSKGVSDGEAVNIEVATAITPIKKDKLKRIVIAVDYAEFENARWVGEDSVGFRAGFNAIRQQQINVQADLASRLKQGEPISSIIAEITRGPDESRYTAKDLKYRRSVYAVLSSMYRLVGADTLSARIIEPPRELPSAKTR